MDDLAFVHGGNVYEVEKKHREEIIDFSANINPLGLPLRIKKIIYNNFARVLHYPDPKARKITRGIAKSWGINEQNVLLGNGSVELIYLIMSAYRPETSLIPVPTFSEYERAAKCVKSRIRFLKLKEKENFRLNLSRLNKADVLFLCNPNNPTGNLVLEDCRIIEKLANGLLVIDEAFMDFLPDEKNYTLIWKAAENRRIIVLRTFTKFFALPGLRIGYAIAHQEMINKLKEYQPPWSANSLAQMAAELILDDREYINKTYKLIEKERQFLFTQIDRIEELKPYPSVTNFLLVKINDAKLNSFLLRKRLIQEGIMIRDCANFRGLSHKFMRIAVRSHKENLKLLKSLREII